MSDRRMREGTFSEEQRVRFTTLALKRNLGHIRWREEHPYGVSNAASVGLQLAATLLLWIATRVCLAEFWQDRGMSRTDLTEQQWAKLAPLLPQNPKKGHAYKDHKPILNGIVWRQKTGAPWRDIPERYGSWRTCHDRFTRWSRSGVWAEILAVLQLKADAEGKIDWEGAAVDSTHVKAHRSAVGARKEPARLEKRGRPKTSGWASVAEDARLKSTS